MWRNNIVMSVEYVPPGHVQQGGNLLLCGGNIINHDWSRSGGFYSGPRVAVVDSLSVAQWWIL